MHTPFFPAFRARLAPLGRQVQHLRQQSLLHLDLLLNSFLPPGLLSQSQEGAHSRERSTLCAALSLASSTRCLSPTAPVARLSAKSRPSSLSRAATMWTRAPAPIVRHEQACHWTLCHACVAPPPPTPSGPAASGMASGSRSSTAPASACLIPQKTNTLILSRERKSPVAVSPS